MRFFVDSFMGFGMHYVMDSERGACVFKSTHKPRAERHCEIRNASVPSTVLMREASEMIQRHALLIDAKLADGLEHELGALLSGVIRDAERIKQAAEFLASVTGATT